MSSSQILLSFKTFLLKLWWTQTFLSILLLLFIFCLSWVLIHQSLSPLLTPIILGAIEIQMHGHHYYLSTFQETQFDEISQSLPSFVQKEVLPFAYHRLIFTGGCFCFLLWWIKLLILKWSFVKSLKEFLHWLFLWKLCSKDLLDLQT